MKKTLLATAIAGAMVVSASASAATVYNQDGTKLDIYGNIQIAYKNVNDAAGDSQDAIADNGTTFGFAAEHAIASDLTGYLKLEFDDIKADEMATDIDNDDAGDTAYVGLKGSFGDVRLGSYDQLIDDWIQDPVTNNEYFDVSDSTSAHGSGADQQTDKVTYTSPSFGGLQFALGTQYKGDDDSADSGVDSGDSNASFFGGAKYTAGAFSLAAVYDNLDNVNYVDPNGDVDSIGDQYGITAQYTMNATRFALKVERFESDADDGQPQNANGNFKEDTNFYGVSVRHGYGMGDVYGAYQYVDVGGSDFSDTIDEAASGDYPNDSGESYNEVIVGATYNISSAMYTWAEVAMLDRTNDQGDGFATGITYLF
ncbi:porin [Onishia niordana]|uniref:porin n=1 Tax=Onishia niordana TaxID=2508711 RepID=UPI00109EEC92|nr:porin [Halomonas niordiana]